MPSRAADRPRITCTRCKRPDMPHAGRGLCAGCMSYVHRHGDAPPETIRRGRPKRNPLEWNGKQR